MGYFTTRFQKRDLVASSSALKIPVGVSMLTQRGASALPVVYQTHTYRNAHVVHHIEQSERPPAEIAGADGGSVCGAGERAGVRVGAGASAMAPPASTLPHSRSLKSARSNE